MNLQAVHSGKLRAIGYDVGARILQVQLEDGSILQYQGITEELWRRFRTASSPWSFYRDNIEEEYTARKAGNAVTASAGRNPLDDLF